VSASGSNEEIESIFGGGYTDSQWEMLTELAGRLGIGDRMQRDSPRHNRDLILDRLGYAASWGIENGMMGLMQEWFTTCRRCGATIALHQAEEGHLGPLDQHTHWHASIEGVLPDGRKVDG
jgi:hypothetical protein